MDVETGCPVSSFLRKHKNRLSILQTEHMFGILEEERLN